MTPATSRTAWPALLLAACSGCPNGTATLTFEQIDDGNPPCPVEPVRVHVVDGELDFEVFAGTADRVDGGDECTYYEVGSLEELEDGGARNVFIRGTIAWEPGVTETELFVEHDGPLMGDSCAGNYRVRISFD
jgi:hypothetical protein